MDEREEEQARAYAEVTILLNESVVPFSADCNRNTIPDACDIANQGSEDLNADGIPDECEGSS